MTSSNLHRHGVRTGKESWPPGPRATLRLGVDSLKRSRAARIAAGCWALLALPGALAQNGPVVIGIGTTILGATDSSVYVAPGDVVTLQVFGLKTVFPEPVKASGVPLPTVLAGISVNLRMVNIKGLAGPRIAAPLFSIEQRHFCGDEVLTPPDCLLPLGTLTSITIQVPIAGSVDGVHRAVMFEISENDVLSGATNFGASDTPVNIRVLTACWRPYGICERVPAVTHADGTLVTADSPAKTGEVVVIYATGLGETNPRVPAGEATPAPAPRGGSMYLQFNFSPNAGPGPPYGDPATLPRSESVGLTPGHVGLYQINVRIPDTIPPVPPCGPGVARSFRVSSNLTITVSANIFKNSFDGAAICVTPPQ